MGKRRVVATGVLAFFFASSVPLGASGGPLTVVLLDESNSWGRLRVVSRYFESQDRTLVVATFFAADGSVASWACDSSTEECLASFPWGSMVTRSLANGTYEVEIYGANQLLWAGTADGQGNLTSDTSELPAAVTALALQNQGILQALRNFGTTQGDLVPDGEGFRVNAQRITAGCAIAIVSFAYSYVGILACATPASCVAAVIIGHALSVWGMAYSC